MAARILLVLCGTYYSTMIMMGSNPRLIVITESGFLHK